MSSVEATQQNTERVHEFILKRHHAFARYADNVEDDGSSDRYEVEQGENWLRLLQKEGRSVLDDTQCTQATDVGDGSQESSLYPSIVALSNVGMLEAPSESCYICVDLDQNTLAIKDMRILEASFDGDNEGTGSFARLSTQLGIKRTNADEWEVLSRRQLRILVPGDRICTSIVNGMPYGNIMQYSSREKVSEANDDVVSPSLLTQPNEGDEKMSQDEDATQTQSTLLDDRSIKLEIMTNTQELRDDDSDKTVELQHLEAHTERNTTDGVLSSTVLATQPESDDETDQEENAKSAKAQGKQVDKPQKTERGPNKTENLNYIAAHASDATVKTGPGTDAESVRALVDNFGDETDVEDSNVHDDAAKKNTPPEKLKEKHDEKMNASDLKIASPEDFSNENLVTEKSKHGSRPSREEKDSVLANGDSQNEATGVAFSPSLCGETEDPPESNPKIPAQNSASLLSPVKEVDALEESVGQNSVSLLSPAKPGTEEVDKSTHQSDDQNSVSLLEESEDENDNEKNATIVRHGLTGDQQSESVLRGSSSDEGAFIDEPLKVQEKKEVIGTLLGKERKILAGGTGSLAVSDQSSSTARAPETPEDQKVEPITCGNQTDSGSVGFGNMQPGGVDSVGDTALPDASSTNGLQKSSSRHLDASVAPKNHPKSKDMELLAEESQSMNPKKHTATVEASQKDEKLELLSKEGASGSERLSDSERNSLGDKRNYQEKVLKEKEETGLAHKNSKVDQSPPQDVTTGTPVHDNTLQNSVAVKSTIEGDLAPRTAVVLRNRGGSRKRSRKPPTVQSDANNETPSSLEAESVGSRSARKRTRHSPAPDYVVTASTPPIRVITTGIELTAAQKTVSPSLYLIENCPRRCSLLNASLIFS